MLLKYLLIGSSTILPLLLFSFIEVILSIRKYDMQLPHDKEIKRIIEIEIPTKIQLVKGGYLPSFFPRKTIGHFLSSDFYPIGTLPNTNTFLCDEGYGHFTYKSDKFGLRNKNENWDKISKEGATFFVGDSYTQGFCVDNESTFTEVFARLTGKNTINLGNGANGPYEYIAHLKGVINPIISSIKKQKFTVVLVMYDNDNIRNDPRRSRHLTSIKPIPVLTNKGEINPSEEYNLTLKNVIYKNYPTDQEGILNELEKSKDKFLKPIFKQSILYRVISLYPLRKRINELGRIKRLNDYSPSINAIRELKNICNIKTSCIPYVAYIPGSDYWRPNTFREKYMMHLKKNSLDLKIDFINGLNVLDPSDISNYSPIGSHLSEEGYKKFAELLKNHINDK